MAREDSGQLGHEIADIEIINVVENALRDPSSIVLDINIINTTYLNILEENGIETQTDDNYKRHLKALLKEHITDIEFVKAKRLNEPDKICSKSTLGVCIDIAERTKDDNSDLKMLMKSDFNNSKWKYLQVQHGHFRDPSLIMLCHKGCTHS